MSAELAWEEKFAALKTLDPDASLMMRKPGDWYVSWRCDVKERDGDGVLHHRYGNGPSPADAVEDHWRAVTSEQPLAYIVVERSGKRRHVRWAGFMWVDVPMADATEKEAVVR